MTESSPSVLSEARHLVHEMLSVFRAANPVTTLKLSPPPHQLSPYSPLCKRATFTVVFADTSNSPPDQPIPPDHPPSVATCPLQEVKLLTTEPQQLPFLTRPVPVCDIGSNTGDITANQDTSFLAPTAHLPTSSFPVHGPFDLMYCIQNGGFGSAWAAKDRSTDRLLCLKVFQSLRDENVTRSVRTELKMFRRMVKSRGGERGRQFIIELNRSIQLGSTVLFAMELMTTDLSMYLATHPERCKMHARQWMAQMALGIESLHEMGIIHRDIKSENILIDSRENVRIVDFGLSYLEPTGQPLGQGSEYAIEFVGTPPYMAPEVLRNKEVPVHRRKRYGMTVDWWALGCILFELESCDHQILFDVEEDVHAYVAWTQRPCQLEETYSRFEGFEPAVVSLLEGLLRVQPRVRYCLNDLEKHEYFRHHDGISEFDNAALRALDRPLRPELVPRFTDEDGPIKVIEAAKPSSIYDWTNLKWAQLVKG